MCIPLALRKGESLSPTRFKGDRTLKSVVFDELRMLLSMGLAGCLFTGTLAGI